MARSSIKLDSEIVRRAKRCAEIAGYSSVEEFVQHVLEKELVKLEDSDSDDALAKKLQGLGYIE